MEYKRLSFSHDYVTAIVEEYETHLYLAAIMTDARYQKQGHGTSVLLEIIGYAKKVKKPIITRVTDELDGKIDVVIRWFKKHGFYEETNGIQTDYSYNFRKD